MSERTPSPDPLPGRTAIPMPKGTQVDAEKDLWDLDEPSPPSDQNNTAADSSFPHSEANSADRASAANLPSDPDKNSGKAAVLPNGLSTAIPPRRDSAKASSVSSGKTVSTANNKKTLADIFPKKPASAPLFDAEKKTIPSKDIGDLNVQGIPEPRSSASLDLKNSNPEHQPSSSPQSKNKLEASLEALPNAKENSRQTPYKQISEIKQTSDIREPIYLEKIEQPELPPEPQAGTSLLEKIAIAVLVIGLALAAIFSVQHFRNRVTIKPWLGSDLVLPVAGEIISIRTLETYWRKPNEGGDNPDIVRRGTVLLPVVSFTTSGGSGSGALRILFRNDEGLIVGDPITRTVTPGETLEIPATAGFEDSGAHAAYRIGGTPPWTVQILEAKDRHASRESFQLILDTEISATLK